MWDTGEENSTPFFWLDWMVRTDSIQEKAGMEQGAGESALHRLSLQCMMFRYGWQS